MKLAIIDCPSFRQHGVLYTKLKDELHTSNPSEVLYLYKNYNHKYSYTIYWECKKFCIDNNIPFVIKEIPINDSGIHLTDFLRDCNRVIITATSDDCYSKECEDIAWTLGIPCKIKFNSIQKNRNMRGDSYTSVHIIKDNYFTREIRDNSLKCHSLKEEIYQFEELQERQDCITLDVKYLSNYEVNQLHIVALDFGWLIDKIKQYKDIYFSDNLDFTLSYTDCGINHEIFSYYGITSIKKENLSKSLNSEFDKIKGIERFCIDIFSHKEIDAFIKKRETLSH